MNCRLFAAAALLAICVSGPAQRRPQQTREAPKRTVVSNTTVRAAELHFSRIPRPYWEHRIQMCRAMGMNTISLHIFWNIHEQREDRYDFTGQNDVAEFCRLAQKNGMQVIVKTGTGGADWEMGGLPWWLLKQTDISLDTDDFYFAERKKAFEEKVDEQLAPLSSQKGGPVIRVEHGNRQDDNVSSDDSKESIIEFFGGQPSVWGERREPRSTSDLLTAIDEVLSQGGSFSLYMAHGGTNFSHWAGAGLPGFAPRATSYDYEAPISEQGQPTPKFWELRTMMQKYISQKLPAVPKAPYPLIAIPKFQLKEFAPLILGVDSVVMDSGLLTMEQLDMGWGVAAYITTLPEMAQPSVLALDGVHDFAQVFIDDKYVGSADRSKGETNVQLPPVAKGQELKILVDAMGRMSLGEGMKDNKGLVGRVTMAADVDGHELIWNLKSWTVLTIPDDYATAQRVFATGATASPSSQPAVSADRRGYYRGHFSVKRIGDTFLNVAAFGRGQVWVNGHAIGRYWNVGPQQTLYVPGCWLKKGQNEIVVLDVAGPQGTPACQGLKR